MKNAILDLELHYEHEDSICSSILFHVLLHSFPPLSIIMAVPVARLCSYWGMIQSLFLNKYREKLYLCVNIVLTINNFLVENLSISIHQITSPCLGGDQGITGKVFTNYPQVVLGKPVQSQRQNLPVVMFLNLKGCGAWVMRENAVTTWSNWVRF